MKIAIVAPASRLEPEMAARVTELARKQFGGRAQLEFHPQCFLIDGHFAGPDKARASAVVEAANDASFDAVWFGRGGYGSCRLLPDVLPKLKAAARTKAYLGYSDLGAVLAGLYRMGFEHVAHGPMPADIMRSGGDAAVLRALAFLLDADRSTLEPGITGDKPTIAFNLTVLSHLIGTPWQPDVSGHVLMIEDVSEHMYRVDRSLFHVTSNEGMRKAAGIRLGRVSDVLPNEPEFGKSEEDVVRHWCQVSGIPYLGRADIGHDAGNKIVPFGRI